MKWHTFYGRQAEMPAPDFCLTSDAGDTICDSVYRQLEKQVLAFPAGTAPAEWQPLLAAFSDHAEAWHQQGAEALALLPASAETIKDLGRSLPYHFPLLADMGAQVRHAYDRLLGEDAGTGHLVFVLDTFGAPYAAAVNADPGREELYDQIDEWLRFIAIQCPE